MADALARRDARIEREMHSYTFELEITSDQYLEYYRGAARTVIALTVDDPVPRRVASAVCEQGRNLWNLRPHV